MWQVLSLLFFLLPLNVSSVRDISTTKTCSQEFSDEKYQFNSSGVYLTLYHPRSLCSPAPLPDLPFSTILVHDNSRVTFFEARLSKNSSTHPGSLSQELATIPLNPGTSVGTANYVTRIGLGTPSTSYVMVVDTGSSLCWLQCLPCSVSCHKQAGPIFDPEASSTYRRSSCTTSECSALESATLNPSACSRSNSCIYEASYGDGSFSVGYLSLDTLSFGQSLFPNFIFGCGQDNEGIFGRTAGIIGLARNRLSLLYQLAPSLGRTFSYCLPSTSSSGYLSIGSIKAGQYSYTPMVSNSLDASLYFLRLSSISVNGQPISVSSTSYVSLPTIIDSGTVITRLPSAVYSALSKAVVAAMAGAPRAPAYSILDTCFKGSSSTLKVAAVSVTFQGGATIKLSANNVLIDVTSSTTCLAFAPANSVAILGNTQQQSFSVLYDVGNSRIGFAASGCQ
ncbi:Eukaryotic aspartyl protease family protein [Rhynchospora pubera]|uniref:Eukaryotic aspartyl protease family protein n=1 Tax=Rhynchospora pubera TaxID=906938 RepID=A0AAV8FSB6_9POAL|nr:Eukaryotic aspartyl protease family protein [Rhynchospora pubera]